MTRPRMHGGYTRTQPLGPNDTHATVVYWTCAHTIVVAKDAKASVDCPTCGAMTDGVLEEFIKKKSLIEVEP